MFSGPISGGSHLVVRSALLVLVAICFGTLPLQAGTVTLSGTEWTLSVGLIGTENGTETYRVTLRADTEYYTQRGTFLSDVAFKISDRT